MIIRTLAFNLKLPYHLLKKLSIKSLC